MESRQYDWSSVSPSTAVVETVAAATGRNAIDLDPLYEAVNPDALDAVVTSSADGIGAGAEVWFTYDRCRVTVGADGTVRAVPRDDPLSD